MVFENRLDNGVRVVGEIIPHFSSVSLGVWIGAGSIYERKDEGGASHFIEHMLFKSTKNRTPTQIAVEMDSIGGSLNAFTAKECTCYYAKTLDRDMGIAADILSDMIENPLLAEEDIQREKSVICEEISMSEDSPEDVAHEALCALCYEGEPLALPITGNRQSVTNFTRDRLLAYMNRMYAPENMVIACAGNFEEKALMDIINERFSQRQAPCPTLPECGEFSSERKFRAIYKDVEQAHICLGLPGVPLGDELQYPIHVLNNILGGSMSSRLFQKIREERGLAYSVYSYTSFYRGTGYLSLYAGVGVKETQTVLRLMLDELLNLKENGITDDELSRSKRQLKNSFLMGQESTASRSSSLGRSMIIRGRLYSPEEILDELERVCMDDIHKAIEAVADFNRLAGVFVGKQDENSEQADLRDIIMNA